MKYGRPLLIVTASLLIGFALALTPAKGGEVATNENQTLSQLLDENRTLGDQVSQLQEKLDEYEKTSAASDTVAAELAEELAAARMEAGLVPLTGPGIRIELDARYVSDAEGSRQAVRALSDGELLRIINELQCQRRGSHRHQRRTHRGHKRDPHGGQLYQHQSPGHKRALHHRGGGQPGNAERFADALRRHQGHL